MLSSGETGAARWRNGRLVGLAIIALGCLIAVVSLSWDIHRRLEALRQASSDNALWVISQSEVELLRFQTAVLAAVISRDTAAGTTAGETASATALDEVRLRFDVVYSRIALLEESPLYAPVMRQPDFAPAFRNLAGSVKQMLPLIDGDDGSLHLALPRIAEDLPAIHANLRALAIRALRDMNSLTEAQRTSMSATLIRLTGLAVALFAAMGILVLLLRRLWRQSQAQSQEIARTGARLETVINTSVDGILVTDAQGRIQDANPAVLAMFGLPKSAILGRDALKALCPADVVASQRERILAALPQLGLPGATAFRLELEAARADGSRFPIELSLSGTQPGTGTGDDLIVGYLRDISKRRENDRRLAEALETARAGEKARERFLAVMSHEMRTPLNGIVGTVQLLAETPLSPAQRDLVDMLQSSGRILLGHVNSVLDVARANAGEIHLTPAPVDIDRLIEDCIANQTAPARAAGNRLRFVPLTGPIGMAMTDPTRLSQILLNLLGNAVKFTRDGTITIETETETGPQGGEVEIRVIDTGQGIPEDRLDTIFDDFVMLDQGYARTAEGTGLGLGIARRIARAMGGDIGAESDPGDGSLFWLRLPLLPVQAAPDAPPVAAPSPLAVPPLPRNVLIIEDNAVNRFILRSHLESAGHRVTEAVDGLAGATLAGMTPFEVILTDISMPGLDGVETVRRIRQGQHGTASAKARILAVTAHAQPSELAAFRAAGMDGCLVKPVDRDLLLATVAGEEPPRPGPATPPTTMAILDRDRFDTLARQIGHSQMTKALAELLVEGDATMDQLQSLSGTPSPDPRAMAALCHRLAGSTGTFGALSLSRALITAEQALLSGTPPMAAVADLPAQWATTRLAIGSAAPVSAAPLGAPAPISPPPPAHPAEA